MVTVCVWLPEKTPSGKNVGHAGMKVGRNYVSWWPDESAGPFGSFYPQRNKSFASDVRDEGKQPDHNVKLNGLDDDRILEWWDGFGLVNRSGALKEGPLLPYQLLNQNCSTVVATGLKEGNANLYASWGSSWSILWRPQTVLEFALSISKGLGRAARPT